MTTIPNLPALPATKNISGADIPIPLSGDGDYRASLSRARGNSFINVKDYGAVGDSTTDDRAAIQAAIDVAEADGGTRILHFPRGVYRVVPVAGVGLTSEGTISVFGEGHAMSPTIANGGSTIMLDSTTAGDVLWLFTNPGDSTAHINNAYDCVWRDIGFRSKNPGTANQHCFQFGNGIGGNDAHQWVSMNIGFRGFSGLCYHCTNITGVHTIYFGSSSSWLGVLLLDDIGGFLGYTNAGTGDGVIGTGMYFQNIHVFNGGWNDTSPWTELFDFKAFREIIIDNIVIEGGGISVAKNSLIRFDGEGWNYINGLHYEQSGTSPTYNIYHDDGINSNGTRHTIVRGAWGLFDNGMKLSVCNVCKVTLDGVRGNQDSTSILSSDLIEYNTSGTVNSSWSVEIKNHVNFAAGEIVVTDQHVGRVRLDGIGSIMQAIHLRDTEMPLVEASASKDGWLCGLVGTPKVTNMLACDFAQFYIDEINGTVIYEIGLVNDEFEGRVFAVRARTNFPYPTFNFSLPSSYLNDADGFGAQIGFGIRWRYIHQEGANQLFRFDGTATPGWHNEAGYRSIVTSVDKDTWYSTAQTAITEGTGTSIFRPTGSDTITAPVEFRISHVKMCLGGEIPRNFGSGGFVSATVNQMRPIRSFLDQAPTWGDYIVGDTFDNIAPSVGNPIGWICTTAGAMATAWAPTTAYEIGDWVENDTPNRIYKCTVAGTSAGSGGPTGTGTGITDNTVTWDFHDTEAVFTAMANL